MELKARKNIKAAAAPETLQDRVNAAFNLPGSTGGGESTSDTGGAAEAAGVLTAIDEDSEGSEEAELPREFEYHSDGEGGDD